MLTLQNISKHYGSLVVLDSLDLEVRKGEFLTLLGPSGSGKSTVLSIVAGITHPDSGRVVIGGVDRTGDHPRKRNVGVVFQGYALFPHLSAVDNVAFPLQNRSIARPLAQRQAREMIARVGLAEHGDKLPAQLSGGQQQRVALARAIVFEPSVLLLDEPLSALDRQLRLHLRRELQAVHRSTGTTIVFVTHDQEEAMSLSDRVCVINRGRVEQIDTPENLYLSPRTRFVAEFLGAGTFLRIADRELSATVAAAVPRDRDRRPEAATNPEFFLRADMLAVAPAASSVAGITVTDATLKITGTITKTAFLGSRFEITCRGPYGEVEVIAERRSLDTRPQIGQAVELHYPVDQISIFQAS